MKQDDEEGDKRLNREMLWVVAYLLVIILLPIILAHW